MDFMYLMENLTQEGCQLQRRPPRLWNPCSTTRSPILLTGKRFGMPITHIQHARLSSPSSRPRRLRSDIVVDEFTRSHLVEEFSRANRRWQSGIAPKGRCISWTASRPRSLAAGYLHVDQMLLEFSCAS